MLKILKNFKRKNKVSKEPKQEIKLVGVNGNIYSSDYYETSRGQYIVDKQTGKIVDVLKDVKRASKNLNV